MDSFFFSVETSNTCENTFEKKEGNKIFTISTPNHPSDYGKDCEWTIDIPQETYQEIQSFEYQLGNWETECRWDINDLCECGKKKMCKEELMVENEGNKTIPITGSGKWEKLKITDQGFSLKLDRHTACEATDCKGQIVKNSVNCDDECANKDATVGKRKGFKMTSSKLICKISFFNINVI